MNLMRFALTNDQGVLIQDIDSEDKKLVISFENIDDEYTVVITHPDGTQFYRTSVNRIVEFPAPESTGIMRISISAKGKMIPCTTVNVIRISGRMYYTYALQNLNDKYLELLDRAEKQEEAIKDLNDKLKDLEKRIESLLEGYDID